MKTKLCVVFWLFCVVSGMAQKEMDSLISASTPLLFDQPDRAIKIAESVLVTSKVPETRIRALTFMSHAYLSKRQNSKSLTITLEALELAEETDSIPLRIEVLNSLGMQHQLLRINDKAKEFLDQALVLTHTVKSETRYASLLAYNYTIRGFIYREQMNCEIAQDYFDRAIAHFKQVEKPSHTANISTLYYNKGNCFLQTTQIDSAKASYQESIYYAEKVQASSLVSFAKKGLSEVYTAEGKYNLAIEELTEAVSIASDVGDLVLNRGIYQSLANNYLPLRDTQQYEFYDDLYQKTNQDLLNQERTLINESLQNSMDSIKTDMQKELKKLNIFFTILLCLSGFAIILLVLTTLKLRKHFLKFKKELYPKFK